MCVSDTPSMLIKISPYTLYNGTHAHSVCVCVYMCSVCVCCVCVCQCVFGCVVECVSVYMVWCKCHVGTDNVWVCTHCSRTQVRQLFSVYEHWCKPKIDV